MVAAALTLLLALRLANSDENEPVRPRSIATGRPNIVFILTDDLTWNLVPFMPHVLEMQKQGVSFQKYFVTDSLCCPSRASIFTGRYPHNTGVFTNGRPDGGIWQFHHRGLERETFAIALSAAGYRTALMGKYLNGYRPELHPRGLGWSSWAVAGNGYPGFDYDLREDAMIVHYGRHSTDYLTDVLSGLAVRFIKQAAGSPFFLEVATFTPHSPYTPAPRDADALPGLRAPRTPAFDAAPDANAPNWLLHYPALSEADVATIDQDFRKRAQSVLAIDLMIGELQAAVAAAGQEKNTYFVFSSDNGYHMGEYRLRPGKMTAYDTDIRVPLVVTGPGVPAARTIDAIVENVDLCPTFTELAGTSAPRDVDGSSLVPLLRGNKAAEGRNAALIEHRGPRHDPADPDVQAARSGNPPSYEAIRTPASLYVEYRDGEKEYHDLAADPDELRNGFSTLSAAKRELLHATLQALRSCQGTEGCREVRAGDSSIADPR